MVLIDDDDDDDGSSLQWRHNGWDCVSNHQPEHYILNRLFGRISAKTSKLCVTGLCAGTSTVTGEFPAQMASNAENASIWWRHHSRVRAWAWSAVISNVIAFRTCVTYSSKFLLQKHSLSITNIHLKISFAKNRPFGSGLIVWNLRSIPPSTWAILFLVRFL